MSISIIDQLADQLRAKHSIEAPKNDVFKTHPGIAALERDAAAKQRREVEKRTPQRITAFDVFCAVVEREVRQKKASPLPVRAASSNDVLNPIMGQMKHK